MVGRDWSSLGDMGHDAIGQDELRWWEVGQVDGIVDRDDGIVGQGLGRIGDFQKGFKCFPVEEMESNCR